MPGSKFKSFYLRVEGRTKPPTSALVQNLSPSTYGGRTNQVTHEFLYWNLSPFTYGWKDEPSHSQVPGSKFKSSYLRMEGRTKPPASALVQNLSPSTYRWKDEPSHSRVSWSKFKLFYLQVEGRTKLLTSALVKIWSPTTYGWKYHPSRPRVPWWKFEVFLPTGGQTSHVTQKGLGQNLSPLRDK